MKLFIPDKMYSSCTKITPDELKALGIRTLLLDVDNTLSPHHAAVAAEGILEWINSLKSADIKVMIVSNSKKHRVAPFAASLGLDFESTSLKPLCKGFARALKRLGGNKKTTAIIGDQLFTDVLGARLFGIKALFVKYIELESGKSFILRRKLEKIILKNKDYN